MRVGIFLISLTCIQICSSCYLDMKNGSRYNYSYNGRRLFEPYILSSTITCSNLYSINEIFYQYEEKNYDQFLRITDSNITTVHPNELSQFTTIVRLYLSGIQIKQVLPGAFNGLIKLKQLFLDRNELTEVSEGTFTNLQELTVLDLSYNKIHRIEKSALMGLSFLEKLNLQGNNLSNSDDAFDKLERLLYLDLSGNPIKKVKFGDLPYLSYLYLNNTLFKNFSDLSSTVESLKVLNMSSNQITSVDFSKFPKVEVLELSGNNIKSIESYQNINVEKLILDNNQIRSIKCNFNKLTHLSLSHNELESIDQTLFNNSHSIFGAYLNFNKISTIEADAFRNLSRLISLELRNNNITELKFGLFEDLTNLTYLSLAFNRIDKIPHGIFNNLLDLAYLDLSHNNILELHTSQLYSLRDLKYLYFDYNKISSFDVKDLKTHLPWISRISLDGNSWKCKQLVQMIHMLKNISVIIKEGDSYDVENLKGIACQNDNNLENNMNISKAVFEEFQQLINVSVKNSDFHRFLNEDFKNSTFVKFFEEFNESNVLSEDQNFKVSANDGAASVELKSDPVKAEDGNTGILVLSLILQVVMCLLLILIAYVIFGFLKKMNHTNQDRSYSQVELCSNET